MNEIIHKNWLTYFLSELKGTNTVYIISPFITKNIVDHLISNFKGEELKIITRFNLNDFRSGVSSLSALKAVIANNGKVKGIKNLHSKVYLFDKKSTIITSANFTAGGFFNNYEFGVKSTEIETINESLVYFKSLWNLDSKDLSLSDIEEWENLIKNSKQKPNQPKLPDYGLKASIQGTSEKQCFIKFFGKTDHRVSLNYESKEEIKRAHCHWALTFSGKRGRYGNGRPRKYKDGDIVYMARMLEGGGYAIFGKGIALRHNDNRDCASAEDIVHVPWKKDWPVYIRVKETQFIDTKMGNCPQLGELMNVLGYDSFPTTQDKYRKGYESINPKDSLRQQADIRLTDIAAEWLENKFQEAKESYGTVSNEFLGSLYQGTPSLNEILNNE
jgi:hypothetical protein